VADHRLLTPLAARLRAVQDRLESAPLWVLFWTVAGLSALLGASATAWLVVMLSG
jgi:hypothetical protein